MKIELGIYTLHLYIPIMPPASVTKRRQGGWRTGQTTGLNWAIMHGPVINGIPYPQARRWAK